MNQGKRRREQEYSWESPSKGWPGLKRHVIYFRDLCGELVTQLLVTERRKKKKKGFSESSAGQEEEEEAEQRHERNGNFNKKGRGGGGKAKEATNVFEKEFLLTETWDEVKRNRRPPPPQRTVPATADPFLFPGSRSSTGRSFSSVSHHSFSISFFSFCFSDSRI